MMIYKDCSFLTNIFVNLFENDLFFSFISFFKQNTSLQCFQSNLSNVISQYRLLTKTWIFFVSTLLHQLFCLKRGICQATMNICIVIVKYKISSQTLLLFRQFQNCVSSRREIVKPTHQKSLVPMIIYDFNFGKLEGGTLGSGAKGGDTLVTNLDYCKIGSKFLCLMVKMFMK